MLKFFLVSLTDDVQYTKLAACLNRLRQPGNPHPPTVLFNNKLLVQVSLLKKNSAWSIIQTLFEKSFPQNELPPVKHLIRTVQKNYFPFRKILCSEQLKFHHFAMRRNIFSLKKKLYAQKRWVVFSF